MIKPDRDRVTIGNRSIKVRLTSEQCTAAAWWLRSCYIPYAVERWKMRSQARLAAHKPACSPPGGQVAAVNHHDLVNAAKLARFFSSRGKRKLKPVDRAERNEAVRVIDVEQARWFGALYEAMLLHLAPNVRSGLEGFPDTAALDAIPNSAAQELLLTLGASEAMIACARAAWGKRGRRKHRTTIKQVRRDYEDERYQRRRIARAKRDELWDRPFYNLWRRSGG